VDLLASHSDEFRLKSKLRDQEAFPSSVDKGPGIDEHFSD
jgi:hypothetical protein